MFRGLIIPAVAVLMVSAAWAQSSSLDTVTPDSVSPNTATTAPAIIIVTSQRSDQWLASKFAGTDVLGSDNRKIGTVDDILFDRAGKVQAYVIGFGGLFGISGKAVAFAPSSFKFVRDSRDNADKLKIALTGQELRASANFKPYGSPETVGAGK
jgi:hypothetical protein